MPEDPLVHRPVACCLDVDDPKLTVVAAAELGIGPTSQSIGEIEIDGAPVSQLSLGTVATISGCTSPMRRKPLPTCG